MLACPEWSSPPARTLPMVHCSPAARLGARAPPLPAAGHPALSSGLPGCHSVLLPHQGAAFFPARCSPLLSWHGWWMCRALDLVLLAPLSQSTGASRHRARVHLPSVQLLRARGHGWGKRGCLCRCGWLPFAEGGTAGELRSALGGRNTEATRGALPGHEGHGAVATVGSASTQPWVHGYPAAGMPQSRAGVLRLCLPGPAGE